MIMVLTSSMHARIPHLTKNLPLTLPIDGRDKQTAWAKAEQRGRNDRQKKARDQEVRA
ncbi:hypothetical protein I5R65_03615 [Herbaspirillum sp. AP02]|uniref:hypothetical protein n=1 Tax=unclassified Herbaspirillum TaxID=2624150 RepID=UPI0015DB1ED6|nr:MULTISPECIES: hypothetical protein [unclassified Herbaspirillum]MBG7618541.1 hypothetical protein [Herbaspirillum sp. AP02]NZD68701.1 hypothetical protein [Herbaspirillum sp. AP21]